MERQPQEQLVITIGTGAGSVQGLVVSGQKPVDVATVVLIPEGGHRFQINHPFASTDASGRFQIPNVPPGDYKIFAWETAEPGAWQHPDFIRGHEAQGKLIKIVEGGKHDVELTSIP